jgi:hypothetical protein
MHFILDQNFPLYTTGIAWPSPIRVAPLSRHDAALTAGFEDWQVIRRLGANLDVDGFITCDTDILNLPTEMVALNDTRLPLVVADGVGHNPVRATGLVMVHLHEVSKRFDGSPQVYVLRPSPLTTQRPGAYINKIAARHKIVPNEMISRERRAMAGQS